MIETHFTLIFFRRNTQILLAMKKRGFGAGKWNGVGGKIELDETVQQAAIRESEEEIGIRPLRLIPVAEHVFHGQHADGDMTAYTYICDKWEGEPIETEEMAPQWFDETEIPYESMWPNDQYWLPKVLAGEKVFGTYRFDEHDRLLEHTVTDVAELPHESDMRK